MDPKALRKMTIDSLKEAANLKRKEIIDARLKFGNGKAEGNVCEIRNKKSELARINTILHEKEHANPEKA